MTTNAELSRDLHGHPAQVEFWNRWIREHPEPTLLPRDHLGGRDLPAAWGEARVALEAETVTALRRLTRGDPALLAVLLTAAAALAAARATGEEEVSVVTAAPGRAGSFPVAFRIERGMSFRRLLADARAAYLSSVANADAPVEYLLRRRGVVPGDVAVGETGLDCPLRFAPHLGEGPEVRLRHRAGLFSEASATRLAAAFAAALRKAAAAPDAAVGSVLDADGGDLAGLAAFNRTDADPGELPTLHGFLERRAALMPDRVAVVDDGTTFGELNRRANRLARRLRAVGVGRGAIVGVCLPRSPLLLCTLQAVLKAGAAYLPIDPTLPQARIAYLLEQSRTSLVLGEPATRAAVDSAGAFIDVTEPADPDVPDDDLDGGAGPGDLAYVIYTSGSTGRPKGVMIEHRAIVNRLAWMQRAYPIGPGDVVLQKTPFTFDVSVWELFWWTLTGAAVCTLPSGAEKDPERIAGRIAEFGVTTMHFVPSLLTAFLRFGAASGATGRLASLRRVFASGEALATSSVRLFTDLLGGPHGTALINLYGPTEAAVDVSHFDCARTDHRRAVPIGGPIDNTRLHILTRDGGYAPIGTPGELCIAGTGLARGYLRMPELTAQCFVPDPAVPGTRMYRTGDRARWLPEGTIEFLGRLDTQIKIRGYRIEPGEIEHVAVGSAGVAECAVAAVPDAAGDAVLCAYVVVKPGFREEELRGLLAAQLPVYMVPAFIIPVESIPTGHNGKRDLARLPAPGPRSAGVAEAPANAVERQLCRIWAQALGASQVGMQDNFFTLGGDSIKFIEVLSAMRAVGLDLSFQEMFAHATVRGIAAKVRHVTRVPAQDQAQPFGLLDPADRERLPPEAVDAYPLTVLQSGLLYEVARRGKGIYHDIVGYRLDGGIDPEVFRAAVRLLVARHPIFRTSFHPTGFSVPIQVVHADAAPPLEVIDLSGMPPEGQERAIARAHDAELARGFELGTADLIRMRLFLLGEHGSHYAIGYHAAALDGWSVGTIQRDLFDAYFALLGGETPVAAAPSLGYGEFVRLEREALASAVQRDFWLETLDGAEATRIPRYCEATAPAASALVMRDVPLPDGLSGALARAAAELQVPVKSVLLAAHVAVMGFVAGSGDVLTGYEHSGRPEVAGGEDLPGLFLNTIPLRVRTARRTWAGLVRHVYEAETGLLPHRRYPMGEMKRLRGMRDLLFESVFNFTHFHVLRDLARARGLKLIRSEVVSRTEFPFRAEFSRDAFTDEVRLSLHYAGQEFPTEQIDRLAGYYVRALELITTRLGEDHSSRTLMGPGELALLTATWAGPRREMPPGTMLDLFAEQVRHRAQAVAVSHGTRSLDYRTLDERSDRVAAFLRRSGVARQDVVAVPMPRGIAWAVSVLAVLKAGAIYLPQDPGDPVERLGAMLRRSQCHHVLATGSHVARLRESLAGQAPVAVLAYEKAARGPAEPMTRPAPGDIAYIIFTSGSTGEPKGAMITHTGMLNHLQAKVIDLGLGADDRVAQVATQCFDISVWQLLAPFSAGGRSVVFGPDLVTDLPAFLDALHAERISILEVVPSHLDALLAEVEARPRPLSSLRYNLVTGEMLPPTLTRRWFARYDVPLVNAYGPTEASDDVTHHVLTGPATGDRVPVGRPIDNTRLYVVGPDGRLMPVGGYGEVCVTGSGVGLGYVNDPWRTAAVFVPNAFDGMSPTLYRTGDVGRWLPSGVLDCAGRLDHQVKVRGFRIELNEIEAAFTRLPGIEHAVALVRRAAAETTLAAFYTGDAEPRLAVIRKALSRRLPAYQLPDAVIRLDTFPLTPNGKVDRTALEHSQVASAVAEDHEPPADEAEATVLEAFTDVLGMHVGVTDDFFDRGGHSLAAMKVVSRFHGRATLADLLVSPTARSFAARLGRPDGSRRPLLVDLSRTAGLDDGSGSDALVCVPYAGGGVVSYLPLAGALRGGDRPIRVYGVEPPGRTRDDPRPPIPGDRLAGELAREIAEITPPRVALLGHSAGAALALTTGLALAELGVRVSHLFVVAGVLKSLDPGAYASDEVMSMSDEEIQRWLVGSTGVPDLDIAPDAVCAFRRDVAEANRAYARLLARPEPGGLACPVTVVLAADDPQTRGRERHAECWGRFCDGVRVVIADTGTHYLNATRPSFLAERIREACAGGMT